MIAFWTYDLYPYCLSGTIVRENPDGTVYVKEFMGNFRPVAIMPDVQGKEVAQKLESLKTEYNKKLFDLRNEFVNKASDVASFIKR